MSTITCGTHSPMLFLFLENTFTRQAEFQDKEPVEFILIPGERYGWWLSHLLKETLGGRGTWGDQQPQDPDDAEFRRAY
ncbi:hypothetical protein PC116_g8825 [Phytophthora cactorum]|uniref:Uncharacterized protein n=1 Tax=Phytophthora cactorum TaxID=29920 RepID=A0A329SJA3_9STRA|nr:hypothetical protein PC117_g5319 [Phytophthora cactorum]KAG3197667.1 hypothetical protein PC128_g6638 [Phytophthora cactorum]KAG4243325.1 hypothetical protein PC116_g8825 [Phytophthora cactorum]RAW36795.1 hypothetical protein PC110_g6889 [Phytophthora cactorum]